MKRFFLFVLIFSLSKIYADSHCVCGKTFFAQRSQDSYQYLYMTLNAPYRFAYGNENMIMDVDISIGWEQNFKRDKLSSYFLNPCGCLTVGPDNHNFDVRASDLGLSADFEGCAALKPKYGNAICYFDLFWGLNNLHPGLWLEFMLPAFTHSHWNPCLGTSIQNKGSYDYYTVPTDIGLVSEGQDQNVITNTTTAPIPVEFRGPTALNDALENGYFGNAGPLLVGRFYPQNYSWQSIYNLHFMGGYNFWRKERGNLGVGVDFCLGVGNYPPSNMGDINWWIVDMYQGGVGSQHCSKLGGILRGQYELWNAEKGKNLSIYSELSLYNRFKGKTTRVLGLCVGGKSIFNQWLLLKKYVLIDGVAQYMGLEHAANLLKAQVQSQNNFEMQFNLMGRYKWNGASFSLGYNFFHPWCRKFKCV